MSHGAPSELDVCHLALICRALRHIWVRSKEDVFQIDPASCRGFFSCEPRAGSSVKLATTSRSKFKVRIIVNFVNALTKLTRAWQSRITEMHSQLSGSELKVIFNSFARPCHSLPRRVMQSPLMKSGTEDIYRAPTRIAHSGSLALRT